MLFKKSYSVPANTTAASPDWQKLQIAKGEIVQWTVFMPEEAADLLKVRVEYHSNQLLPFTRGESIYGIFKPTSFVESIEIDTPPYELDIYASNTDDTFEHEYNIYCNILPKKPVTATGISTSMLERMKERLGGLI